MAIIKPFKALRFTKKAGELSTCVCPPYDIIPENYRLELLNRNPYNIVRLELPKGEDPYNEAGSLFSNWIDNSILAEDDKEGIYVYEQEFNVKGETKKIRGIITLVKIQEFSDGIVLPHEETLSKAKTDRFNLMKACNSNFSQIYSMFLDPESTVKNILDPLTQDMPTAEFIGDDSNTHKLWTITDTSSIKKLQHFFSDKQLYIADGHHRYETALNYKKFLAENGKLTDQSKANYVMMFLIDIDDPGLVIFPTHRLVRDLPDFDENQIIDGINDAFEVEKRFDVNNIEKNLDSIDKRAYAFYTGKDYYYLLTLKDDSLLNTMVSDRSEAYRSLDVTALHSLILERVMKIDKENMAKQINLTYTRNYNEAIESVVEQKFQCSFILKSTKIHQIKNVAAANDRMPQKSTYFYPKLITGMVMNKL